MSNIDYLKKYYKGNIEEAIKKLELGIPVQYIVGNVDFYGNTINVNENVLIPRFETEELVSRTIKRISNKFNTKINILDLCSGSGCIGITLKKEVNSNVTCSDISLEALKVSKENAKLNNVDITFMESDIFSNINDKYDVIISNPPYITYDEEIDEIVKNNEPSLALYADNNGLYFYEEILKNINKYLNDKYIIAFEIGYKQGNDIINLINKYLKDVNISLERDLQGKDRFIFIEQQERE